MGGPAEINEEDRLILTQIHTQQTLERQTKQTAAEEAEAARLIQSAPPSLQQLVLDHGTYDKITPEAWARFDHEMAAWKAKVRYGEFPAKIHPPPPPKEAGGG